ncbi:unnamed protein product [Calypogeia fissa]
MALTINPEHHQRTKHIGVQWHYVREQVKKGLVTLRYLPIGEMPADGLTKPFVGVRFAHFIELLGLATSPSAIKTSCV